jgi:hypothetical protein
MRDRRGGGSGTVARRFDGFDNLGDKTVAALGKGLNEAWIARVIAEKLAQFKHVGTQNLRLDIGFRPKLIEELVVGDEAAGIFDQVTQDCERLGRQSHCDAVVEQALIAGIEPEGPKLLHSDRTSG